MFTLMIMSDGAEIVRPQVELEWGYAMMLNGGGHLRPQTSRGRVGLYPRL